jgi:hypothetical protein
MTFRTWRYTEKYDPTCGSFVSRQAVAVAM